MLDQETSGLSEATQLQLIEILQRHPLIEKVVIYGSRAMGNFKPGSDIDLTIIGEELGLKDLLKIQSDLDDLLLPYKIDLSLFHQLDNVGLKDHIQRVGKVFYSR